MDAVHKNTRVKELLPGGYCGASVSPMQRAKSAVADESLV
jgi:hypothetical protein